MRVAFQNPKLEKRKCLELQLDTLKSSTLFHRFLPSFLDYFSSFMFVSVFLSFFFCFSFLVLDLVNSVYNRANGPTQYST